MRELLARVAGEYRANASIYGIPELAFREAFELEAASPGLRVMGGRASLPVGPAAGPNSQIAPCLVAAYLAGARVFELKTVQENDALDIEKPCIYALDEGHNVEWSTELSLEDARAEYLRGWMALNLLAAIFSAKPRDFFFNMSVGYTLDGIKGPKVDAFIEGMRRPSRLAAWRDALGELTAFVESRDFAGAFGPEAKERATALLADFPESPVHSVTLSTMHGCPPAEIERIGAYLIEEKGFDAYVKLNPTLLGYDRARSILDRTGWKSIEIKRESFERDLQFRDALALVSSLSAKAEAAGRRFGVKLSNTLANANSGGFLPGAERYMSGRALFPLTARLAAELAAALPDFAQRFSYCGGVSSLNAAELIAAGAGPLTVATDILKPGGYLRLGRIAREASIALPGSPDRPDAAALDRLAESALSRREYAAGWKAGAASIAKALPAFDCFAAPCVEACPAHQKAPAYIREAAAGASKEALATILDDNPLPFITGTLCDHACQYACSRNDYEGPVEIRACKLECARAASIAPSPPAPAAFQGKVAVIGAGPAGLSCAHYLALAGVPVTVFDKSAAPGGVPANVIPKFRIPREDIAKDIERITSIGVEFRFGTEVRDLATLKAQGYSAFFAALGAPIPRALPLEGSGVEVVDALEFLERPGDFAGKARIVVAGGGNTAMDAARSATRLKGVRSAAIAYRRTRAEMPADAEELGNALREIESLNARSGPAGQALMELCLPERAIPAAGGSGPRLVLRRMRLGEPDASGRRAPLPSDETIEIECDLLVSAIGEAPDAALLESLGAKCGRDGRPAADAATQESSLAGLYVGGDASRGPASIIAAIADGRRAAYAIMRKAGIAPTERVHAAAPIDRARLAKRGRVVASLEPGSAGFVAREAERCLECDSACLRCVEVCPNRANIAIPVAVDGSFRQSLQILHVDHLCNECGNCGFFCPWEGEPFRGKASLFATKAELERSGNAGFAILIDAAHDGKAAAGDANATPPRLAMRAQAGGEIIVFSRDEWGLAEAGGDQTDRESCAMAALAGAVLRDHPYLIGGRS
jgi:putative selenate reductase